MQNNTFPGFVINNSTIAVDFWPKKDQSRNISHFFLTHCHSDHTKNLDSTWNTSKIYCSKLSKKLLIELNQVREEYINELELDRTYIFKLDDEESFNVSLIDSNHCPGAVMFLFEGYFGTILATGDFRYTPSMLDNPILQNLQVDICYLDNTYFNPLFSKVPTRDDALRQIISIIEQYRCENVLFKLLLKNLGKERLLVDLVEYFRVPIVLSHRRFERLTKILEIDKKYFAYEFTKKSFIFVDDEPVNRNKDFVYKKKIIYIEPTGLKLSNANSKCDTNYFRVPYTDHSSYPEIISFVREIKPKKIIPIVRKMLPNETDTTDLTDLEKYLNKNPIKDSRQRYSLLLKSSTSTRTGSKLNSISLNQSKSKKRVSTPITTRFVTLRKKNSREQNKKIEYETPKKVSPKRALKSPRRIPISSNNRSVQFSAKNSHPSKLVDNFLEPILEDSRNEAACQTESGIPILGSNQIEIADAENNPQSSSDKENSLENSKKWRRLNDNVELLVGSESEESIFAKDEVYQLNNVSRSKVLKKFDPIVVLERIDVTNLSNKKAKNMINDQEKDTNSTDESIYIENTIEDDDNSSWQIDTDYLNESIEDMIDENLPTDNNDNQIFLDFMQEKLKDYSIDLNEIGQDIQSHILDSFVF